MYSAQLHCKRAAEKAQETLQEKQQEKHHSRSLALRSQLAENYSQRINHFMLAMMNDPILVKQHVGPLPVAGRITHPEQYKGAAVMIMKGFRTDLVKPSETLPKKRRRIQRPALIEEKLDAKSVSFAANVTYSHPLLPQLPPHLSRLSSAVNTRQPQLSPKPLPRLPAAVFTDLDRKTHFKGVMAKLIRITPTPSKDSTELRKNLELERTKTAQLVYDHGKALTRSLLGSEETVKIAKDVLKSCQVIPKLHSSSYLRVGDGKLTSNPFQPTRELYRSLYHSHTSSFCL